MIKIDQTIVAEQQRQIRIAELKQKLNDTDYKVLPDYDKSTEEIKTLRQSWRNEIRQLEAQ